MLHLCPNPARRHPTLPDQRVLRDPNLSLTALGLLTRLMNTPSDSSTDPVTLSVRWRTSRGAVNNAMRELTTAGLLLRTTVRLADGHLHTVTLICDDPTMLLTELARLNTSGLVEKTVPETNTVKAAQRRRARHARPAAAPGPHERASADAGGRENAESEAACPTVGERGDRYHHCVLRTTYVYMRSQAGRNSADQHPNVQSANIADKHVCYGQLPGVADL
jgi:hypothetical protein